MNTEIVKVIFHSNNSSARSFVRKVCCRLNCCDSINLLRKLDDNLKKTIEENKISIIMLKSVTKEPYNDEVKIILKKKYENT